MGRIGSNLHNSGYQKINIDAVIICHDHAPGYGKGYFIATPKMDTPSVALAEKIEKNIPEFIYYRATAYSEHGSSTFTVSYPLAKLGIPTLVYEMPSGLLTLKPMMRVKNLFQIVSWKFKITCLL